jgi:hypothetical protein
VLFSNEPNVAVRLKEQPFDELNNQVSLEEKNKLFLIPINP